MDRYYVSKITDSNPGAIHEVHTVSCSKLPSLENRIFLGYHALCAKALMEADKYFHGKVDGCKECIPECHRERTS